MNARARGWLVGASLVLGAIGCAGQSSRPPPSGAEHLDAEGLRLLDRGDLHGAEAFLLEALREAELVDDLSTQAAVWTNLGALAVARGDAARAWASCVEALRLRMATGVRDEGEVRARTNLGSALLLAGREQDARAQLAGAVSLAREIGAPAYLARVGLGSLSLRGGDAQGALQVADDVARDARRSADPGALSSALSLAGAALEARGDLPGATARFEEALSLDRSREQPAAIADDLRALARLADARGDRATAAELLVRAAGVARRMGRGDAAADDLQRAQRLAQGAGDAAAVQRAIDALRDPKASPP